MLSIITSIGQMAGTWSDKDLDTRDRNQDQHYIPEQLDEVSLAELGGSGQSWQVSQCILDTDSDYMLWE